MEYPFTDDVRKMDPSVFVKDILVKRMRAKAMVVGPDCSFGYKGAGNVELLRSLSKELGFELYVIQKKKITEETSAAPISGKNFPWEMWQKQMNC